MMPHYLVSNSQIGSIVKRSLGLLAVSVTTTIKHPKAEQTLVSLSIIKKGIDGNPYYWEMNLNVDTF